MKPKTRPQASVISFNDGLRQAYDWLGNSSGSPSITEVDEFDIKCAREAKDAVNRALGAIGQ